GGSLAVMPTKRLDKSIDLRSDERRMRFDDDPVEVLERGCYRLVVLVGHRVRIEEIRSVVQLHLRDSGAAFNQRIPRGNNLCGDRALWRISSRRISPQVAHDTTPGTFFSGQK